ncbi:MAG: excinuclease ABC subunit UvrC [Bdellovibrionales bacterium]|nr:excinuclease ABC subunit UvrC [Bdellovibrionales bacterium]
MNETLQSKLDNCPPGPGVYLMKDEAGHVIYVGKAKSLKSRVRSYFQKQAQHSPKTLRLVSLVCDIEFLRAGTEVEALLLENNLIKKWKPKYNIRLKDDKTYPYIKLDMRHDFPRAYVARKLVHGDGNEYYGPYPNGSAVHEMLRTAARVFMLRDCRDHEFANRSRPCLSYQIGQCTAPCVDYVTKEQYAAQVNEFRGLLKGDVNELAAQWEADMADAAEKLEYERAAKLRDRLVAIREISHQEQRMEDTLDGTDRDIWAVWPDLSSEVADTESTLDILILQFRGGKWVGRTHRTADLEERLDTEDFLASLMLQHYSKRPAPTQILVPENSIPEREAFAVALGNLREKMNDLPGDLPPPDIRFVTEKGEWAKLWELALENVKGLHEDEREQRDKEREALVAIARMLDIEKLPERMECVDISNLQGEANVASCVVFRHGRPDKNEYRHYNIQGFTGQNDFASMREVMSRRYGKPDSPVPDLLVIDGGKGQLSAVVEILKSLNVNFPVVGLAKARTKSDFRSEDVEVSEERLFLPGVKNAKPIKHAGALRILTHLRDEAHRFAIEFHRLKRGKARGLS